jgi:2-C-methyl-D-erythritol 2,4-cyclodiphosphate synthase
MSGERRAGIGYDAHAFGEGRVLVLGGVEFPDEPALEGHSDADVLAHAVIDALLGAAGLGDIGRHFPDDDPRFAGADSIELLAQAAALARREGWQVVNVDATVICEKPRLAPQADQMAARLAEALGLAIDRVNVKATTNEGMGFIGRGEGIAALAIAQIEEHNSPASPGAPNNPERRPEGRRKSHDSPASPGAPNNPERRPEGRRKSHDSPASPGAPNNPERRPEGRRKS